MEVKVDRIRKGFPGSGSDALKGISFTAESGCITSLVGASGCGKTTTLRCIAGLESIEDGDIWFGTTKISSAGRVLVPTAQRNIGMVFQSYAIWPHLTVAENIAFGLRARKWPKSKIKTRVREVLALVDLPGFDARYPGQLSGGQQQRVALGRALAYEPSVLLMDEPLANLDAHLRGQMRQTIRRLQQQTAVTMIYVTHDRVEALELSDSIVILDQGQVVQQGTPAFLFDAPTDALVARFVGHSNFLTASAAVYEGKIVEISTPFGVLRTENNVSLEHKVAVLVRPEAISLAMTGEQVTEGWFTGRGRVLTKIRSSGGVLCTFETEAGVLELFVSDRDAWALNSEVHFQINPAKCQVLPHRNVSGQ